MREVCGVFGGPAVVPLQCIADPCDGRKATSFLEPAARLAWWLRETDSLVVSELTYKKAGLVLAANAIEDPMGLDGLMSSDAMVLSPDAAVRSLLARGFEVAARRSEALRVQRTEACRREASMAAKHPHACRRHQR